MAMRHPRHAEEINFDLIRLFLRPEVELPPNSSCVTFLFRNNTGKLMPLIHLEVLAETRKLEN